MKKILLNTGQKTYKNVVEPIYINSNFIQKYNGEENIIYAISSVCALHLLEWILIKMNKMNTFTLTKSEKLNFIKESGRNYSLSSVKKSLNILIRFNIIETTNEWIGEGDKKYKTRNIDQSKLRGYPKIKGIYFCIDQKKNRIIYIGQSISVYARLASNPHFNHRTMLIRIMHCDDKKRMWYERRWILRFIPKYNTIPNKDMNYKFNPYRRN